MIVSAVLYDNHKTLEVPQYRRSLRSAPYKKPRETFINDARLVEKKISSQFYIALRATSRGCSTVLLRGAADSFSRTEFLLMTKTSCLSLKMPLVLNEAGAKHAKNFNRLENHVLTSHDPG